MPNSIEKGEFLKNKIQSEKSKRQSKPKVYKDPSQRLTKSYDKQALEVVINKMRAIAQDPSVTLMTQLSIQAGFDNPYDLYQLVENHPELRPTFDACKLKLGINAYEGIESRKNIGTYSRFSVTRFLKEVRQDRDEEREFELKKIQARKEAQKQQYEDIITEVREKNGKKVAVISVDENILLPDEE